MKKLLAALALAASLFAAPAQPAPFFYNFEGTHNQNDQPTGNPIGTITNHSISMTPGQAFQFSRSAAVDTVVTTCSSTYAILTTSGDGGNIGIFRNAPSGTWAGRYSWAYGSDLGSLALGGDIEARTIVFDPPIKFFSCWIAGVTHSGMWSCPPWVLSLDNGATWNTHLTWSYQEGFSSPEFTPSIELWDTENHVVGITYPEQVDSWSGCDTEDANNANQYYSGWHWHNTPLCNWQYIEITTQTPASMLYFRMSGATLVPIFIDDITASTGECPNPPCEFEGVRRLEEPMCLQPTVDVVTTIEHPMPIFKLATPKTSQTSWGKLKLIYR